MLTVSRRLLQLQIKKLTPPLPALLVRFSIACSFACALSQIKLKQTEGQVPFGRIQKRKQLSLTFQRPLQDFPGSPVVKAPCSQCQEYGFNTWLRN